MRELRAVVEQNNGIRVTVSDCHEHIQLPLMGRILEMERNRNSRVNGCRDRVDMIVLWRDDIDLNDLNHAA